MERAPNDGHRGQDLLKITNSCLCYKVSDSLPESLSIEFASYDVGKDREDDFDEPNGSMGAACGSFPCGLLTGCTDDVKFEQVSAQQQALETNVYLNSENLILKLAPTDEEWLADPVDVLNVIKNFKANLLRGQRGKQLRIRYSGPSINSIMV